MKRIIKKIIFLLTVILISIATKGQDRVNGIKPKYNKISGSISYCKGWKYDNLRKEWFYNWNVICNGNSDRAPYDEILSHYNHNFKKITARTFLHNDVEYYILMVYKIVGRWTYPELRMDWTYGESLCTYTFLFSEIDSLKNVLECNEEKILIRYRSISKNNFYPDSDQDIIINTIKKEVDQYNFIKNNGSDKYLPKDLNPLFHILKTKTSDGDVVRFLIDCTDEYFQDNYYEIELSNFKNFYYLIDYP